MRWASAISEDPRLEQAVVDTTESVAKALEGESPDLIAIFVSPHHSAAYADAPGVIARKFPNAKLVGCSAEGVIGAAHEIEHRPAFSLTAAVLPRVEVAPFHLGADDVPAPGSSRSAWERAFGMDTSSTDDPCCFVLLPDPFSCDAGALVRELDRTHPGVKKIGGLASGARRPGENALFLGKQVHRHGVVGVALRGDIEVETIIAQGCRPIGAPMLITRCDDNILLEIGNKRPLEVLRELFATLDERDRELAQHSLFVGIEMKDQREYHQGDFLIRNIMGIDPKSGALRIGAVPKQWQVVQFHLRDSRTSAEDLGKHLDRAKSGTSSPEGALLFSCLGRGEYLYGRPDHDTGLFSARFEATPLGGFFCNGEIGPVGGTTFLHGYTSAFGLFRPKSAASPSGGRV